MSKRRVLYFVHGHPELIRGGAEEAALELYKSVRAQGDFEPFLCARTDDEAFHRPGTRFGMVNDDPNQILFFNRMRGDDQFFQTMGDKRFYTRDLDGLLRAIRPDVVHFQHTVHIGMEAIRQVRATLPHVPIIYTLHEYIPICNAQGQMVRTGTFELCDAASPQRCHGCFPDRAPAQFLLRERAIKSQFALVDRFVAPSRFLLERFVQWGLPAEKLTEIDYGRQPVECAPHRQLGHESRRDRFGFFGQLNPYKGIRELLLAARLLRDSGRRDIRLEISGTNLNFQHKEFQESLRSLIESAHENVTFLGAFDRGSLRDRIASVDWVVVPSIWWENSPLVIQEAFLHGRPVICSDIGGMAEKVKHGHNGLHFRVGDPAALADTLRDAVDTNGLWDKLRAGIPPVPTAEHAAATHVAMYHELLARRSLSGVS